MWVGTRRFATDLWNEIEDDNVFNGAAALAYYLILSMFPAAIFLLSLLPYLPVAHLQQAIMDFLHQALPEQSAAMFQSIISGVVSQKQGGLLTFGLVLALWSGSSGIYAIMQQLNITYDVKEGRPFWKARGTALFLLVLFFLLIIGGFALVVFGGVIQDALAGLVGRNEMLLAFFAALRWVIIAVCLLLGFALIYHFGPDVEQQFRFVSPGSIAGVVLLALCSLGFRYYIARFSDYNATYGSLGAIIIMLVWLYIAGLVLLIGSEINALVEHYSPEGKSKGQKNEPRSEGGSGEERERAEEKKEEHPVPV
jgi:membrane protein